MTFVLMSLIIIDRIKGSGFMEPKEYIVSRIEGEYAYLHDVSEQCKEDIYVALFLLPMGVDVGSRLMFNFPEYTLLD